MGVRRPRSRQRAAVCGRGTGDFLPLIVFEAPRVPQPATGADAFLLEDASPQRVRPRLVTTSPPSPTLRSLSWRRATPARRGAFPGTPGTVITCSCDCCGGAEASGGFTSSRLLMDRRWQSQRARGQPRAPASPGVYVRQRALWTVPPARPAADGPWPAGGGRALAPRPGHFITGAAAGPLRVGGRVHVFHLVNSVYIQLISAY